MPYRDKEKQREYNRAYYRKNAERVREYNVAYSSKPEVVARQKQHRIRKLADPQWVEARRQRKRAYYLENRDALLAQNKQLRDSDIDRVRDQRLRYCYGLTLEQVEQMRIEQGGTCAICCVELSTEKGQRYHVDHCHASGRVRALLCYHCNRGLGSFRDNPEWLRHAASYLERFR